MFYGFLEFGCIPNIKQPSSPPQSPILEQASAMFKSGMGFPPSSTCWIKQVGFSLSWWSGVLYDGDHVRLLVAGGKIVKLIHPRITKMGFALESYPCYPTKKSESAIASPPPRDLSECPFSTPGDDRQSQIHICQQSTELIWVHQLRRLEVVGTHLTQAKLAALCT